MLLEPEQSFFLRENLKLRLLNARLALLARQFETAQGDLQAAQKALDRYFDRTARRTVLAAELLRQVAEQARQTRVPRPDDTLAALAAASRTLDAVPASLPMACRPRLQRHGRRPVHGCRRPARPLA